MATLKLSGLASGFDWSSFVDQIMELEHAPVDRLETEKSTNTQKLSALTTLGTKLTSLQTAVDALKAEGLFTSRTATSSTSNSTWSLSAANGTATGSYTIAVTQLATAAKRSGIADIGLGISDDNDVSDVTLATMTTAVAITAGTFTVNGQQVTIALDDSLQDVFDKINTATSGDITASYDSGSDKITLSSASSSEILLGAANDTSNFLTAMKLSNNGGTDPVVSSSALGTTSTTSPLASARLRTAISAVDGEGNGSFTVNGVSISYNVNTDSLSTVLARVTSSTAGVTATYDAVNDKVVLTNKTTGDTGISVSEESGGLMDALGLTTGSTFTHGQNALFSVNGGDTLVSSSNTLDASAHGITGLSVTVNTESTETISVSGDTAPMKSAIEDFVEKFNAVQSYVDEQTKITIGSGGDVTTALLASNREIQDWSRSFRSLAFGSISGLSGTIDRLEDMGIDFTSLESELEITDSTKLDDALANHADDVAEFFSNTTTGFVGKFDDFLESLIGSTGTGGSLGNQETYLTNANTSLDQQIADMERRLEQQRELLESSFQRMEEAQQKLKTIQQQLTDSFGTSSSTSSTSSSS